MIDSIRIDKFLWTVRFYKTRSAATYACRNERVLVRNHPVKPSFLVKQGDIIEIKVNPIVKTIQVIAIPKNRIGAKLLGEYIVDKTPASEIEKLIMAETLSRQNKGRGRPTKKDRRDIMKAGDLFSDADNNLFDS